MLSAQSYVDVALATWKNIGVTSVLFNFDEIVGLIDSKSVRFSLSAKRRSGSWIVAWSSPCERNNKEV